MSEAIVLVTGFGPFREHKINASWQAVKLLPNFKIDGVSIVTEEIPVIYDDIDKRIPLLWEKYNPKLVVHVGVSNFTDGLSIETQAFRTGYTGTDCIGNKHHTGEVCCTDEGKDCIKGNLDVDKICVFINENTKFKAYKSSSAGRYLCEFTYYKSLNIDPDKTLFVHVPILNRPYNADELAKGIINVIQCALEQIDSCKI